MKHLLLAGLWLMAVSFNLSDKPAEARAFNTSTYQRSVYCFQDWSGNTGYEIWLKNKNRTKGYTVTIKVEERSQSTGVRYYTRTYNVSAGGETYVGCTLTGAGSWYIGYSYSVVGEV